MLQVFAAGNLGKDATVRQAGNSNVCSFSIATERKVKGEKVTTWLSCSIFGKRGEALVQYLTKGTKVTVIGELSSREHNGKTYLECNVSDVQIMGGGGRGDGGQRQDAPRSTGGGGFSEQDYGTNLDDDVPFALNVTTSPAESWWPL